VEQWAHADAQIGGDVLQMKANDVQKDVHVQENAKLELTDDCRKAAVWCEDGRDRSNVDGHADVFHDAGAELLIVVVLQKTDEKRVMQYFWSRDIVRRACGD